MIGMPGKSHRGPLPEADDGLAQLADALCGDVVHLAEEIGERNVPHYPKELDQTADWIEAEWTVAGYEVRRQEYDVEDRTCCNLEIELRGTTEPEEIVVVGAHYDSVIGTPGANDNGTGVAALLALSRAFSGQKPQHTLRFVAFVNEEPPYFHTEAMGSRVYARRCKDRKENITAMLCLETIGYYDDTPGSQNYPLPFGSLYPSQGNFIAFVGNLGSRSLVRRVIATFRQHEPFPSEGAALPAMVPGVGFSDHWSFFEEGYPAVMLTDTAMFRYPHYHEPTDTADRIDFDRTARVVRGLERVIVELVE